MRKFLFGSVAALAMTASASLSQAAGNLSVYHWFEYIPQELVDKFSKEHDVKVTIDTYNSNEAMLAALKAGKLGAYDVAVPGDYMVSIMQGEGLLDTLKDGELSNKGNIAKQWLDVTFDMGRQSSIPYQVGTTAFMVNRDVFKGDINTLGIIFDPPAELKGKINVLDSQGEVLALASLYLGIPQCSSDKEQLKKLNDLLIGAKPNWASFGSDVAKDVLVSGDAAAGMIYNGFGAKARGENSKLEYAYPKEGYVLWMDNMVLLKNAPNRDNAVKFMNFLLEPENAAAITNYAQYMAGVTGAEKFYSDAVKNAPELNPPADQKGEFIQACSSDVQPLYDAIWTNLKK
jgi:spermidine/putrescine transport system substrate-binding protein